MKKFSLLCKIYLIWASYHTVIKKKKFVTRNKEISHLKINFKRWKSSSSSSMESSWIESSRLSSSKQKVTCRRCIISNNKAILIRENSISMMKRYDFRNNESKQTSGKSRWKINFTLICSRKRSQIRDTFTHITSLYLDSFPWGLLPDIYCFLDINLKNLWHFKSREPCVTVVQYLLTFHNNIKREIISVTNCINK